MRRSKKYFIFFAVSFWLMVLLLGIKPYLRIRSANVSTEKPVSIDLVKIQNSDTKPKAAPLATQIPSAKGVTDKKIYRLAQLMYAENGSAENDDCVLLTGIVAVKRMKSEKYPNTLEGVISQEGQYSTYQTGKIECKPDERCLEIAEEILRFNLQKNYPDSLVFQAEFPQGSKTYKQYGYEYFCLE